MNTRASRHCHQRSVRVVASGRGGRKALTNNERRLRTSELQRADSPPSLLLCGRIPGGASDTDSSRSCRPGGLREAGRRGEPRPRSSQVLQLASDASSKRAVFSRTSHHGDSDTAPTHGGLAPETTDRRRVGDGRGMQGTRDARAKTHSARPSHAARAGTPANPRGVVRARLAVGCGVASVRPSVVWTAELAEARRGSGSAVKTVSRSGSPRREGEHAKPARAQTSGDERRVRSAPLRRARGALAFVTPRERGHRYLSGTRPSAGAQSKSPPPHDEPIMQVKLEKSSQTSDGASLESSRKCWDLLNFTQYEVGKIEAGELTCKLQSAADLQVSTSTNNRNNCSRSLRLCPGYKRKIKQSLKDRPVLELTWMHQTHSEVEREESG
ncbi:hypothetical protein FB451DRAFT_1369147 [Mycena latifolia]|nr:hypothetical protein FB451DRAFT_1369147 [Mycena latifolia]